MPRYVLCFSGDRPEGRLAALQHRYDGDLMIRLWTGPVMDGLGAVRADEQTLAAVVVPDDPGIIERLPRDLAVDVLLEDTDGGRVTGYREVSLVGTGFVVTV